MFFVDKKNEISSSMGQKGKDGNKGKWRKGEKTGGKMKRSHWLGVAFGDEIRIEVEK